MCEKSISLNGTTVDAWGAASPILVASAAGNKSCYPCESSWNSSAVGCVTNYNIPGPLTAQPRSSEMLMVT